jgi:AdoMet-dependent rRNA methyltransferase SPB1
VDVLHKKYEKLNRRHRTGYDDALGQTLRNVVSVPDFLMSGDPVRVLSDATELAFEIEAEDENDEEVTRAKEELNRRALEHSKTTDELKLCFKDLRVLGKIDFKKILKWRQTIKGDIEEENRYVTAVCSWDSLVDGWFLYRQERIESGSVRSRKTEKSEDELLQEELDDLKTKKSQLERRQKKKDREQQSKDRSKQALGINTDSSGLLGKSTADSELFSLG